MTVILVVEDDASLRQIYEEALASRGHRVQTAGSVEAGLKSIRLERPDFVVTDLCLPDGSGLRVVEAATTLSPPVPTVIASGSDSEEAIMAGNASGARDFLVKPFPMSLLTSKIELHLRNRGDVLDLVIPGGRRRAFGRYEIEREIGRGGCGVVYRAFDHEQKVEVALKVRTTQARSGLDTTDRLRRRFQREAYSLSSVEHENLVRICGHGSQGGFDYIAMEFVEGETLEEYIEKNGPLSEHHVWLLVERLAQALSAIHGRGLVHRDLKPANIVLRGNRPGAPVLVDFGLAKLTCDRSLTLADERHGTPAYMAPEQVRGRDANCQSDLFSLGLVACYAASGRRTFANLTLPELLQALCSRPIQIPATLSPALRKILRSMTRIQLDRRAPSAPYLLRLLANGSPTIRVRRRKAGERGAGESQG
ncbi:MAG: protein kinase [Planctomycetes bacterium]|nr:protein kinase [Planctomycetota bacterium]